MFGTVGKWLQSKRRGRTSTYDSYFKTGEASSPATVNRTVSGQNPKVSNGQKAASPSTGGKNEPTQKKVFKKMTKNEAMELLSYLVGNQNLKTQDARYRELADKYVEEVAKQSTTDAAK